MSDKQQQLFKPLNQVVRRSQVLPAKNECRAEAVEPKLGNSIGLMSQQVRYMETHLGRIRQQQSFVAKS